MTTTDLAGGPPLLLRLLASMEKWRASDVFVTAGAAPAARVHGTVVKLDLPVTTAEEMGSFLGELLTPAARAKLDSTGDVDVGFSLPNGRRFRFNIYRQRDHHAFVARALPSGDLTFEQLGLPSCLRAFADLHRGLVLVTGATGSGKSTTLAAMIHHINANRQVHVVTIEDPIEFVHADIQARVSQREIGGDATSFQSALRHVVRQSPDVILIGEMRDFETMSVALSAALTGHLVFASLHTIDASQTLQRILSYFPEHLREQASMDLSLCLQGIASQRLLPRADSKGRAVAVEVLTCSPGVARLIREQRADELVDLMRASNDPSIVTFNRALLELYRAGTISYDIGKAYATNPDEFALSAQGMETGVAAFRGKGAGATTGLDMKSLLYMVLDKGASDLHLTVGRPPILRVAGDLQPIPAAPLSAADMRLLLYSVLNVRQRSIYELEREIDFALALDDGRRFRINAYYQKGNMTAALRAIPSDVPDAASLRLPQSILDYGTRPHGLLLVVGPTGSGKTTTLACLVDRISKERRCRIVTIEDPIEYTHEGGLATVDQREVFADTKSFAAALKFVLRQDPDVIMVGEIRDVETISSALTAAETGHLVLTTLHTNDAAQTIDRIIDVFSPHQQPQVRSQLSSCLLGVISQRLLPRKDGMGRVPVFEVMVGTPAIRTLIRENKMHQAQSFMETHRADGMLTMDASLKQAYEEGLVDLEEVRRYVKNPKLFAPGAPRVEGGSDGRGHG